MLKLDGIPRIAVSVLISSTATALVGTMIAANVPRSAIAPRATNSKLNSNDQAWAIRNRTREVLDTRATRRSKSGT